MEVLWECLLCSDKIVVSVNFKWHNQKLFNSYALLV